MIDENISSSGSHEVDFLVFYIFLDHTIISNIKVTSSPNSSMTQQANQHTITQSNQACSPLQTFWQYHCFTSGKPSSDSHAPSNTMRDSTAGVEAVADGQHQPAGEEATRRNLRTRAPFKSFCMHSLTTTVTVCIAGRMQRSEFMLYLMNLKYPWNKSDVNINCCS